jgi:hypothetical protein
MSGNLFKSCSSGRQLSAPLAVCSQLQLVSSLFRHGTVYFRVTCISVRNTDLLESVGKNVDLNFAMKEFPVDKQFAIL